MRSIFAVALISGAAATSGCSSISDGLYRGPEMIVSSINRSSFDNLRVGMTKNEALAIMGAPHMREAYGRYEFLMYRTEHRDGPSAMTPVAIVNGRVTGWGRNYYDTVLREELVVKER